MKSQIKKIVSIFACICLLLSAMVITASAAATEIVFDFGANGDAAHVDGTDIGTSKSYTEGDYTLALTDVVKCYDGAFDATGISALKMGTGSAVGSFTTTVPDDVTSVIFKVAKYKAKNTTVDVNGTQHVIETSSNDGAYTAVTVDTTTTKTITFATVSNKSRCMIDSITYVIGGEAPVVIPEKTIAEVLAMEDSNDKFYVTAEIVDTYRDSWATYGNFILKDASTDETIIMYGLDDEAGNRYDAMETKPVVGDTVKVLANRSSYNGVGQLANAVLVEYTPAPQEKTIAEVLAMEDGDTKFYVTAEIVDTYRDTWATYGNFILKDDSTDETIIMYGLEDEAGNRYDAMETKPVVGDTVKVLANRSSYNGVGQLANAVLVELTPATPDTGDDEEDVTPPTDGEDEETPVATLEVVDTPVAGTAYKFGMVQANVSETDVYYLAGGMDGYYLATITDADAAIDVYLEETDGGYYLYTMVDGAKTYINMVVNGTHVNGAYEATASTVYTYDATAKTIVADVTAENYDGEMETATYWFGTRNDMTYTTVGPCKTSYEGFYAQFYAEPAVDDGKDDTAGDTTTGGTTTGGTTTTPETKPNTDNSDKSPSTGDNVGAIAVMAIAAAAVVIAASKKRV